MTATEMYEEFLLLYDKVTNFNAPGYEPNEISILLTKAQERVVYELINPLANKYREGFGETEQNRKYLQELIKGASLNVPSVNQDFKHQYGTFYDLPEDCLFVISELVITQSDNVCNDNKQLRVKPITDDYYAINVINPFKKPNINNCVWRLDYQDRKHELITDGTYTISSYNIRYIENLTPIIIDNSTLQGTTGPSDCKLNNTIIHRRIIDEAVKIATGITDSQYYQIKKIEQQDGNL